MTREKAWLLAVLACVGAILVGAVLWKAFTAGPTPDGSQVSDPITEIDSEDPPPEFNIPKVADCNPATDTELAQISARLAPHTGLSSSARTNDGDDVYVAAIITFNDQPTSRDPGLWVIRGSQTYSIGTSSAYSAFPPATDIGVRSDNDGAVHAVACAAGY